MSCPHLKDGRCSIAESLCMQQVPAQAAACDACCKGPNPRQVNRVTVGIAIAALIRAGKDHTGLIREFAYLFELNKPFPLKVISYGQALLRWQLSGRPVRSEDEVQRIYRHECGPCPLRKVTAQAEVSVCGACGCLISEDPGIDNKLWFETEHCPGPEKKF